MAAIPGTRVPAPIVPFDTADTYPTHDEQYGKGGRKSVADITARNAIPAARRTAGMEVYVRDSGTSYILGDNLTTWSASGSEGILPNIAALRALTSQAKFNSVTLVGYYSSTITSAPDGGGGVFVYDASDTTSVDNGGTTIVDLAGRRWKRQFSGAVYPEWFGAVGDDVTSDTAALDRLAAYCVATPGTTVEFGNGKSYVYDKISPVGMNLTGFQDLTFIGYGSRINNKGSGHTIFAGELDFPDATYYEMTGNYAVGDTSVILTTPADTSNFAVGNYIWIRTRQCVSPVFTTRQPVAELNQVKEIDSMTGEIVLVWPMSKDYVKDNTNIDPATGTLYPHGVANASGGYLAGNGLNIFGLGLYHEDVSVNPRFCVFIRGGLNVKVQLGSCRGAAGYVIRGRFVEIVENSISLAPTDFFLDGPMAIAPDTGTSDYKILDNTIVAENDIAVIHLHEGLGNVVAKGNTIYNRQDSSYPRGLAWSSISIRALGWNIEVDDNTIVNAPVDFGAGTLHCSGISTSPAALYPTESIKNLAITENKILGEVASQGIFVDQYCIGANVTGNKIPANCVGLGLQVQGTTALVFQNEVVSSSKLSIGATPTSFFNSHQVNAPLFVDYNASAANGLRLRQTTTATASPRIVFENSADVVGATVYMEPLGGIVFGIGATPGASSGTTSMYLDNSTNAGVTRTWLFEGNGAGGGTLKRVQVGAADSGGVGFKMLRVIN